MEILHWLQRLGSESPGRDRRIEGALQGVTETVRGQLERAPRLRGFLQGDWLDHPLHAAATDVPVGAFTCSLLLDAVAGASGSPALARAADATAALGLAAGVGAALPGIADWSYTQGPARRIGALHGGTNLLVSSLYGASLLARRRGQRALGVGLSGAGFALLLFSAWLGGELTYRLGVGVREPSTPGGERAASRPVGVLHQQL